jgi:hypothetical protein
MSHGLDDMISWLMTYRWELITGFIFGLLSSFVAKLLPQLLLSTALCCTFYWLIVRLVAHAGAVWNNEMVARIVLGGCLGCLVRPSATYLSRAARAQLPRS